MEWHCSIYKLCFQKQETKFKRIGLCDEEDGVVDVHILILQNVIPIANSVHTLITQTLYVWCMFALLELMLYDQINIYSRVETLTWSNGDKMYSLKDTAQYLR